MQATKQQARMDGNTINELRKDVRSGSAWSAFLLCQNFKVKSMDEAIEAVEGEPPGNVATDLFDIIADGYALWRRRK